MTYGESIETAQAHVSERLNRLDARLISEKRVDLLRILHVHSGNLYGGVEGMLVTLARQRRLFPALESSFALSFAGRLQEELTEAHAPVHWLGHVRMRQPLSIRRARRRLRELLRREAFDAVLVHSSWSQTIFGTVARRAALPLIFYLHGAPSGRHWLERCASRTKPDALLCNSHFTAATLPRIYPRLRAEVVYCPV